MKNVVVAWLPRLSVAVITLVPMVWVGTIKVQEKVPFAVDWVVVIVREVPKEREIWVWVAKFSPLTITVVPTGLEVGKTKVICAGGVHAPVSHGIYSTQSLTWSPWPDGFDVPLYGPEL